MTQWSNRWRRNKGRLVRVGVVLELGDGILFKKEVESTVCDAVAGQEASCLKYNFEKTNNIPLHILPLEK